MRIINARTALALAFAVPLALATASCTKDLGGGASTTTDDNAGVTSAGPAAGATTPASSTSAKVPAPLHVASPTSPQTTPGPAVEFPTAPPSAAVLEAVGATQTTLEALATNVAGSHVRFVDCAVTTSCSARLDAPTLTGLRDLLQAVSQQQGGIGFVAREQLDGFTGRTFVADVTMGTATTRAVPSDENALLTN